LLSAPSIKQRREQQNLTEFLLLSTKYTTENMGASLVILLQDLPADKLSRYRAFLNSSQISCVDGTSIAANSKLKLPDRHPGLVMTRLWAKEIESYFSK